MNALLVLLSHIIAFALGFMLARWFEKEEQHNRLIEEWWEMEANAELHDRLYHQYNTEIPLTYNKRGEREYTK
jgi:hypothetical protein